MGCVMNGRPSSIAANAEDVSSAVTAGCWLQGPSVLRSARESAIVLRSSRSMPCGEGMVRERGGEAVDNRRPAPVTANFAIVWKQIPITSGSARGH